MMKVFTTTLIALLISISAFSQEEFQRNEIRLNLLGMGTELYPGISYERILSTNVSVGTSVGILTNRMYIRNDGVRYSSQHTFHLTPYFRWFFDRSRRGSGLFIEANGSAFYNFSSGTLQYHVQDGWQPGAGGENIPIWSVVRREFSNHIFEYGFGLGLGWKFLNENNWVGELLIGGGYHSCYFRQTHLRFSASIGRRF